MALRAECRKWFRQHDWVDIKRRRCPKGGVANLKSMTTESKILFPLISSFPTQVREIKIKSFIDIAEGEQGKATGVQYPLIGMYKWASELYIFAFWSALVRELNLHYLRSDLNYYFSRSSFKSFLLSSVSYDTEHPLWALVETHTLRSPLLAMY